MVDRVMQTRLARLLGYMGLRNQIVFGYKRTRKVQPLINVGGVAMYDPNQKLDRKKAIEFSREEFEWKRNLLQHHEEGSSFESDQEDSLNRLEDGRRERRNMLYVNPENIKVRFKSSKERQYSRQRMMEIMTYFKTTRMTETELKMRNLLYKEEKSKIRQKKGIMDIEELDKELEKEIKEEPIPDIKEILPEGIKLEDLKKQDEEPERPESQFIEYMGKREDPKEQSKLYEEYMKKLKQISEEEEDEESQEDISRSRREFELGKEEKIPIFQEETDYEFDVLLPHSESSKSTELEEEKSFPEYNIEDMLAIRKLGKTVKTKIKHEKAVIKRREEMEVARMKKKQR